MSYLERQLMTGLESWLDDRADRQMVRAVRQALVQHQTQAVIAANRAARADTAAQVVRTALMNTAMLSKDEEQLRAIAPTGEHRYRLIVDTYAIYAARLVGEL